MLVLMLLLLLLLLHMVLLLLQLICTSLGVPRSRWREATRRRLLLGLRRGGRRLLAVSILSHADDAALVVAAQLKVAAPATLLRLRMRRNGDAAASTALAMQLRPACLPSRRSAGSRAVRIAAVRRRRAAAAAA